MLSENSALKMKLLFPDLIAMSWARAVLCNCASPRPWAVVKAGEIKVREPGLKVTKPRDRTDGEEDRPNERMKNEDLRSPLTALWMEYG